MAVNQLIARGLAPIGGDAPQIANMLQQRQQQGVQNALAQQEMGIRQQNADSIQAQMGMATAARQAEATREQYGYAANVGLALANAKTPEEFAMLADRVAADPQYQSIPGVFTREQMTPENVRATLPQVFAKAGMQMPQAPVPFEQTPDGMKLTEQRRQFDARIGLDRQRFAADTQARQSAQAAAAEAAAQKPAPVTPAQRAVDSKFAADYVQFISGGAADATKSIEELDEALATLNSGANVTGPVVGALPVALRATINPKSADAQEAVEQTVQRSLRAILGAQFTEKEGERLIARAYNPRLSEDINAKRVGRLATQLKRALQSKQEAAQYYEQNGTLAGFTGRVNFNASDFNPDVAEERKPGSSAGASGSWGGAAAPSRNVVDFGSLPP